MRSTAFQLLLLSLLLFASAKAAPLADIVPSADNVSTLSWVDGPATLSTYRTDDSYPPIGSDLMMRT